ncbi:unnamed protein product [Nesidiocoris tenuis]|uniref:Uncharacterized protein n=1 Tax=Nesidiocoris tenuis TaxID=355587 RepID=A0A6H5HVE1_9HEMI|nr:unnamed protein product [Nesidiocoris tenuis]
MACMETHFDCERFPRKMASFSSRSQEKVKRNSLSYSRLLMKLTCLTQLSAADGPERHEFTFGSIFERHQPAQRFIQTHNET